ncbi:MAG: hypothetical protein ACKVWR_13520 [Acidimicrobiales bacterium]
MLGLALLAGLLIGPRSARARSTVLGIALAAVLVTGAYVVADGVVIARLVLEVLAWAGCGMLLARRGLPLRTAEVREPRR